MNTAIVLAVVTGVLGVLFAASQNAKPIKHNNGDIDLVYARGIKVFGAGLPLLVIAGLTWLVFYSMPDTLSEWLIVGGMYLALLLFLLYFYIEFFTVKVTLKPEGIAATSGWRGARMFLWEDIEKITYVKGALWFVVEGNNKTPVRVNCLLSGIDSFREHYKKHLPESIWQEAEAQVLEDERLNNEGE